MSQHTDILYMSEYIKNTLYFAITRPGKVFKNTSETYFLCIDNELVYENYFSDFGPLNLGCIYKYCKLLNEKLEKCRDSQFVVHYTSCDPKKSTNAAFLMGCFGVVYLNLRPKEALKPLLLQGYNYRPFQDATPGDSAYTISILDCLKAMDKARELGFYDFRDFNYEDYVALDKIEGGDLNWIVPGKFLAFIGPVDTKAPIYHRPEEYISYFKENNVNVVIRLNKKMYDGNIFISAGILHYDLFFLDGSCPPKNICLKFLRISESSVGAIAVHCKAGLGRTGSLIGCYLIKHYRMTSHEAIGWMRICRPGSVIGQQQEWLEKLEPWLIKQGNLYRKRVHGDFDKLPEHKCGLYSITEKAAKCRPVLFHKSPSPPPPVQRQNRLDGASHSRPQASKIIRRGNNAVTVAPVEKDQYIWRVRSPYKNYGQRNTNTEDQSETKSRRTSGSGESRPRLMSQDCTMSPFIKRAVPTSEDYNKMTSGFTTIPTFCTTQGPIVKTITEAKEFLMRSSACRENCGFIPSHEPSKDPYKKRNDQYLAYRNPGRNIPTSYTSTVGGDLQSRYRRRLGRSPSPIPPRLALEQSRATNTLSVKEVAVKKVSSKIAIRDALSRLKLTAPRYGSTGAGSVGAASLGARRVAPSGKRAPSTRSDERNTATQGDVLNSIKYQRNQFQYPSRENQDRLKEKNASIGPMRIFNRPSSTKGRHNVHTPFY
ncbi:tyrosine-protein phosphatase CDC14 homolog [Papilio machaon]|uniref:tyrosine-protein phosphatase CDC14 homolog n=1 Tax=Papilio machaon TaxID=76193 RepID=UPI001E6630FC|nr:tyrosine-protein phosphatase CDC14 homolog [Papilio machaon]